MKAETKVDFRLDGRWPGSGVVVKVSGSCIHVKLTTYCKEFVPGDIIIVSSEEIYKKEEG